jgi:hypothetical protein
LLICLLVGPPTPCKTLSHINMCIYKVFLHLGMLWMGIWVHPWANIAPKVGILLAKLGFWWIFLLFCLVLGPPNPLRLHPTSISYVCKCFSTLICFGWAYADTLLSLLESIYRNFGVGADLSDVVTSWLSLKPHLECFTNP